MHFNSILSLIGIFVLIVFTIISNKKRKKQREVMMRGNSLGQFNCKLIVGGDKVVSRMIILRNFGQFSNVLLFNDHIAFATGTTKGWQPEIMISDINSLKMEKLLWKELLFIDHNAKFVEEGKTKKYENQFYLSGDKEELLYIKDFIEERMLKEKLTKLYPC